MRIALYISELLYSSDCVIIPGLGGFVANTRSAFLNPAQHTFTPPTRRIAFNASLRTNDGLLAHHISRRTGMTYGEALTEIRLFVDDTVARLQAAEQVWLDKIGTLVFDKENRIQFEPDLTENYLMDSFGLVSIHSPAIRREEGAKLRKVQGKTKEKKSWQAWRLFELIPAAAVLALLVFNPNVVQKLNTGLAQILPLKEIYQQPQVNYSGIPQDSNPGTVLTEPVPQSDHVLPAPKEETPVSAAEELVATAAADSTRVEPVAIAPEAVSSPIPAKASGNSFHIVGGCFRVEENARKLVEDAELLGFEAKVIGQNEKGMYIVSLYSSGNMADVQAQLGEIKAGFEKNAWVLVK
ncbi:MAG: hypothetical protein JNL88_07920 [Bacteroidia bacterium]|nr:hypothetical protein [Bacteroidia bacterium]